MGAIRPELKGKVKKRRDNTDFTEYAEGGEASGRKNAIESIMADIVEGVQSQW